MVTPEEKERRRVASEAKELARLEKEKAKPKRPLYFWYLIVCLCLIYIVDEVATSLPNTMLVEVNAFFFEGSANGKSTLSWMETLANVCLVVGFFYKALADRFGRKPFLIANTLGMVGSLLLCFGARYSGFWMYVMGFFLLRFFVTPDEQIVYIFETAPEKKRGQIYSAIKGISELGLLLIPIGRTYLMGSDASQWHLVFLIPCIIGVVVSLFVLFTARETDAFLDERIAYLKLSPEERAKLAADKKDASKKQGGFFTGIKVAMQGKQLRWIFICTLLFTLARCVTGYYTYILVPESYNTEQLSQAASTMITNAEWIFPLTCSAVVFAYGFLSDKVGRKITSIVLLATAIVGLSFLYVGQRLGWNEWVLGAFIGLYLGAAWSNGDTLILMTGESAPTNLRASIMSAQTAFYGVGMVLSMALGSLVLKHIDPNYIGLFCLCLMVPCYAASILCLMFKVKETKGASIDNVVVQ
jgi:MFS family permease